ncbi:calcium-binding protein [Rhizobium sp.]
MSYVAGNVVIYGGLVYPGAPLIVPIGSNGFTSVWGGYDIDGIVQFQFQNGTPTTNAPSQVTLMDVRSLAVTGLADGGYLAAWSVDAEAGFGEDIYIRRFNADGSEKVAETAVISFFGDQQNVDITGLENGGYVLTWEDGAGDADGSAVFQQRFKANGDAAGRAARVNTTTEGQQTGTVTAALEDGGWVVTWLSADQDGKTSLYQKVFNPDGSLRVDERRVGTDGDLVQYNTSVASLADGGWVVAWQTQSDDIQISKVHYQRYNPDGSRAGQTGSYLDLGYPVEELRPSVVGLKDGGFAIAYSGGEIGSTEGLYGLTLRLHDADGNLIDTPPSNMPSSNRHDNVELEVLGNGNLVAIWGTSAGWEGPDVGINHRIYTFVEDSVLRGTGGANSINGTGERDVIRGLGGNDVLKGKGGADAIFGGNGADRIIGGAGNDQLTGNGGRDTFVFATGFGRDVITDFKATGSNQDMIDLSDVASIKGFGDLRANHMSQIGNDVLIKAGANDWLVLSDVKLGQLSASDFLF